ncbi:MAG: PilZ domain-containing protein [Oscillospiraceae bacterium]
MRLLFGGKVIKVELLDDKGKLILTAEKNFVLPKNMDDDDSIVIFKGKNLPDLERNAIVSVVTTTKANDRIRYTGAVSMSMDTQLNVKILKNNETQVLQERRRYFKIKINEKGRALFYVRGEKTVRYDEPPEISVLDINVGGIFFSCETEEYVEGDLVCVDIDLFIDCPLNTAVKILRVQRNEDGSIKGYGCLFESLTGAQEDYIGRFIMKVQSEQRRKEAAKDEI